MVLYLTVYSVASVSPYSVGSISSPVLLMLKQIISFFTGSIEVYNALGTFFYYTHHLMFFIKERILYAINHSEKIACSHLEACYRQS